MLQGIQLHMCLELWFTVWYCSSQSASQTQWTLPLSESFDLWRMCNLHRRTFLRCLRGYYSHIVSHGRLFLWYIESYTWVVLSAFLSDGMKNTLPYSLQRLCIAWWSCKVAKRTRYSLIFFLLPVSLVMVLESRHKSMVSGGVGLILLLRPAF